MPEAAAFARSVESPIPAADLQERLIQETMKSRAMAQSAE